MEVKEIIDKYKQINKKHRLNCIINEFNNNSEIKKKINTIDVESEKKKVFKKYFKAIKRNNQKLLRNKKREEYKNKRKEIKLKILDNKLTKQQRRIDLTNYAIEINQELKKQNINYLIDVNADYISLKNEIKYKNFILDILFFEKKPYHQCFKIKTKKDIFNDLYKTNYVFIKFLDTKFKFVLLTNYHTGKEVKIKFTDILTLSSF